jgi:4-hydroxy-tetrahydrodipicolinate synthase
MFRDFGAIVTAAITPFASDGSIDHDVFRAMLRHLVATGSDAVVVTGTTGESPTTSDDEKFALLETALDEVGDTAAVLMGTGTNDTRHSVHLTREAARRGAHGALVVTPYYNKPPRAGLVRHFGEVAAAAPELPIMLYNIPQRVVLDLDPELIAEIATASNVVALKQANPDLDATRRIRELAPDLAIYAGNDDLVVDLIPLGALGGVCVASHLVGDQMQQIVQLAASGDIDGARAIDTEISDVYEVLSINCNPIPIKAAMELAGFAVGAGRLPMVAATEAEVEQIRAVMARHNLLAGAHA